MDAVLFVLPAAHAYPAVQFPLHTLVFSANVAPNTPPGHGTHADQPLKLYCPGQHGNAVAFVEPAGQKYPPLQFPVQLELDRPVDDPKRPGGHAALQLAFAICAVPPYRPALQFVHDPAVLKLYRPATHGVVVLITYPAVQKYPGLH